MFLSVNILLSLTIIQEYLYFVKQFCDFFKELLQTM
nr:MAG TPA: hypothetical protein [Caudoviricetes sp.]